MVELCKQIKTNTYTIKDVFSYKMVGQAAQTSEETIYQIALKLVPRVGNINALGLIEHFGSAKAIFEHGSEKVLRQLGLTTSSIQKIRTKSTLEKAEEEWDFAEQYGIKVLPYTHPDYPKRLRNCHDFPLVLFYKGNANLNAAKIVAIVGTRKPTEQGRIHCERLVEDLSTYRVLFVSGLAYGIDVTSHKKCLSLGLPNIGVVAHGLDRIYPAKHKLTAKKMVKNGGVLTEFVSNTVPLGKHFPMRNRIIAGMADVTVVVETGRKGGSMITAHFANEFSKDVFAFPGRVNDPMSLGCNHLIKTHRASLLESAEDIAYIMRWQKQKAGVQKQLFTDLSKQERQVVDLLVGQSGVNLDSIIQSTQISTSRMAALLLELEFKGIIRALPGKSFRLI